MDEIHDCLSTISRTVSLHDDTLKTTIDEQCRNILDILGKNEGIVCPKIYKLVFSDGHYYYGSTEARLQERLRWHLKSTEGNTRVSKIYSKLKIDKQVEIELVRFASKESLRITENNYIEPNLQDPLCLNTNRAFQDYSQKEREKEQRTQEKERKMEERKMEEERKKEEEKREKERKKEEQKKEEQRKKEEEKRKKEEERKNGEEQRSQEKETQQQTKERLRKEKHQAWFCLPCNRQCRSQIEHLNHLTTKKHKVVIGEADADPDVFVCETCLFSTPTKNVFKVHCQSKAHLIAVGELEKHENEEKQYVCLHCQYSTNNKQHYDVHCQSKKHKSRLEASTDDN